MNVTVEEISACKKRLKIEVPADRVSAAVEKATDEFAKFAQIPGFRAGKVPRHIVRKRFLKDIEAEAQKKLVGDAYREAVEERKLRVVSQPQIEDLNYQTGISLSFSTLVELAPDFQLPDYKGIAVKKVNTEVSDDDIAKALEAAQAKRADFEALPEPRPVETGDFAILAYLATIEGKRFEEIVPAAKALGENPNFWLWVKSDTFLPGFSDQVVGMNIGDRKTISVTIPEDFGQAEFAGKQADFSVELKDIKTRKLPEIDDTFAKEISGHETLDSLKDSIRMGIGQQKARKADREQKQEIMDFLDKAVNFDLPESVVESETQDAIYDIVNENQQRGVPAALLEEKKQEIYDNAANNAKGVVKLNFILTRIAEQEKIEVTRDEVIQQIGAIAQQQQQPIDKVAQALQKNDAIPTLQRNILRQKTLDFLLQQAKVE